MGDTVQIILEGVDRASGVVSGVSGALGGLSDIVTTGLGVALGNVLTAAAGAATDALSSFWSGALESEQITARLNSTIKALGDETDVSAEQVQILADKYKGLAGGSDEAVVAIDTVLARAGVQSSVMDQATVATLDLSAALGMDATSAARMLGKALLEPGEGIASLRKAGVALTSEQENLIDSFMRAGDTASAQKVILDALAETTGGAAAAQANTAAGQWASFNEQLSDVGESIMSSLIPVLSDLMETYIIPLLPQIQAFGDIFVNALQSIIGYLETGDISDLYSVLYDIFGPEMAGQISAWIESASALINGVLIPAFQSVVSWVAENWPQIQATIMSVFASVMNVVNTILIPFITGVLVPAFQSAIAWIAQNWPQIQATITTVINTIYTVVSTVLSAILAFWNENGASIMAAAATIWAGIQTTISDVINIVSSVVTAVMTAISSFWQANGNQLIAIAQSVWNIISTSISTVMSVIQQVIRAISQLIAGDWQGFGNTLSSIWSTIWAGINTILTNAWTILTNTLTMIINGILGLFGSVDWGQIGTGIINGISAAMSAGWDILRSTIEGLIGNVIDWAKRILGIASPSKVFRDEIGKPMVEGIAQGIADSANVARSAIGDLARDMVPSFDIEYGSGINPRPGGIPTTATNSGITVGIGTAPGTSTGAADPVDTFAQAADLFARAVVMFAKATGGTGTGSGPNNARALAGAF